MEENKKHFTLTFKIEPDKRPIWEKLGFKSLKDYNEASMLILMDKDNNMSVFNHQGEDITAPFILKSLSDKADRENNG